MAVPRDLPPQVSLPVSYLLGRTRLALAELRLVQAKARDDHAAADREKARPDFPRMQSLGGSHARSGGGAGGGIDAAVIVDFIDETDEAQPAFLPSLLPEDMGLTLAESAAGEDSGPLIPAHGAYPAYHLSRFPSSEPNLLPTCPPPPSVPSGMKHPLVRAKGLLLSGQCLLYKYLAMAPESEHPWPEQLADKLAAQRRRRQRKHRQRHEGRKLEEGDQMGSAEGADGLGAAEGSEANMTEGGPDLSPDEAEGEVTEAEGELPDPPLDPEEQVVLQQQVAAAQNLHRQCEGTLLEALAEAMRQKVGAASPLSQH